MGEFSRNIFVLNALVWKNYRMRIKNIIMLFGEFLFPCLWIVMLILLYKVDPKSVMPMCNFKAKAMPTAGGVLFLQTLLCAVNNSCEDKTKASFESFKPSVISSLGEELKGKFNIKSNKRRDIEIENWAKDFYTIDTLIETIENENEKWRLLYNTLLRSNIYSGTSDEEYYRMEKLSRIKKHIYRAGILNSLYRVLTQEVKPFASQLNTLNVFFCGPDMSKIEDQILSAISLTDKTFTLVRKDKSKDDISDFCKDMINVLENSKYQAAMRIFKPLLIGKIVYTPDAPVINRLMSRIKDSFLKIKKIIDMVEVTSRMWKEMKNWKINEVLGKYKNEEIFLKEAVKTKTGRALMSFFEGESHNDVSEESVKRKVNKFKQLLNETEENYKTYLQQIDLDFIINLASILECIDYDRVIAVSDESSALSKANKFLSKQRLWGYVAFTNVPAGAEKLPSSVSYTMRMTAERAPRTNYKKYAINTTDCRRIPTIDHQEILGGSAYLQNLIEGELIREYTGRKDVPGIYLKQLPYPCYEYGSNEEVGRSAFKMSLLLSWIIFFCRNVKRIVIEKEILFKEILRVFGVKPAHHWIAFFIDGFLLGLCISVITSILYSIIFGNFLMFFIFQLAYVVAVVGLSFLMSTFFAKASYCLILASITYFGLTTLTESVESLNPTVQFFTGLIVTVAGSQGCNWIIDMYSIGEGASLSKMNYTPRSGTYVTMTKVILMLLLDGIIYIALAIYFENVLTTHSVRKPFYYCFLPSYWRNCCKKSQPSIENAPEPENSSQKKKNDRDSKNFEKDPEGLPAGIEVINVTKDFGKSKNKIRVVNNISITFYENQITSFLGHNGAGKSTTVAMMTGVLPVTKGKIRIYGVDLQKDPMKALNSVGLCMQENVLLGDLSAEDHLKLIAKLKNLNNKETRKNVNELFEAFEMKSRASQPVKHLSGGWKRKVCVAMAFMGGSRVIFLDEPTAGIDPFARRAIWDVLIKLKEGRTIVLITHHLDEADLLGDRIVIIASGEIKCCGSSLFLKSLCNKSYILTVESTTRTENPAKKSKNSKKILSPQARELLSLVRSAIVGSELEEERGSEFIFSLPPKQYSSDLSRLFDTLERNKKRMNISSYGVSAISLEEVFIKVLEKVENEEQGRKGSTISAVSSNAQKSIKGESEKSVSRQPSTAQRKSTVPTIGRSDEELKEEQNSSQSVETFSTSQTQQAQAEYEMRKLVQKRQREKFRAGRKFWNHFIAIMILRFIHFRRNYVFVLFQIFGILIISVIFLLLSLVTSSVLPSLTIDVSAFPSGVLFYANNIPSNSNLSSYEDALLGPYSLGTQCVLNPEQCSMNYIPRGSLLADSEAIGTCSCKNGKTHCTVTPELPSATMSSGHRLFNLTGLDLENWLIATEQTYKLNRIGGFTFGQFSPLTGLSTGDFLSLFSGKKLFETLDKYLNSDKKKIDAKEFSSAIMSGLDQSVGEKVFKDKDPSDNIIIWFNSGNKIGSMALMNGVSNLVLRASLPSGTDPSSYSIKLVVHPFKETVDQSNREKPKVLANSLQMIAAFLFASFVIYVVEEKASGMKNLQIICGITPLIYWFTTFLWDILVFFVFIFLLVLLLFICGITELCGKDPLPAFLATFFAYALTSLMFVYLSSHIFRLSSNAFLFLTVWFILMEFFSMLSEMIALVFFSKKQNEIFRSIFMFIPEYSFTKSIVNIAVQGQFDAEMLKILDVNFFEWDLTTNYVLHMLYTGGIIFFLLLVLEYRSTHPLIFLTRLLSSLKLFCLCGSKKYENDDDVAAEKERVLSGKAKKEGDMLILKNLTKVYCGQQNPAVNHVCVGVKHGECLGLLGMNGAGKTTIFKMITGNATPTWGDASIGGMSITYSPIQSRLLIGYCPQMTALDAYLTPKEHLDFFCQIRGLSPSKKKKEVDTMIDLMNLGKHKNKISKTLSGGNQRKLNAAIALLCEPELILLDEPTAGMDVLARRFLWSRIIQAMQDGRCVILTTHSMEECQALATQVCIMFMGMFACFGSSQRLKNKFNEGYIITVRLVNVDKTQEFTRFLDENLPGSTIKSSHSIQLVIKLHPDTNVGKGFAMMGEAKKKQLIDDYSLTQTTLENVFLKLIGEANREKAFSRRGCCGC